ncbi:MAG: hypothetical protein JRN39_05850 [Nitrososphaerota archaeon]|nr:hypothetical protein [Nitrososphaerota archaeon]MDG6939904.1 hypothetical protein [Nitrososphaerota archaeon]
MVITNVSPGGENTAPLREAHLKYIGQLKEAGKLKVAGRFGDGSGGMYVLLADSPQAADALAKEDPYHKGGGRSYVIKEWQRRF